MTDQPRKWTMWVCEICGTAWGEQDNPGNCYVCADQEEVGWRHGPGVGPVQVVAVEELRPILDGLNQLVEHNEAGEPFEYSQVQSQARDRLATLLHSQASGDAEGGETG